MKIADIFRFPRLRWGLLLLWILMPGWLPALAADISVEHHLGFSGQFQIDKWTPVTTVITNRGGPITGVLEIVVTAGSEYRGDVHHITHRTEVNLPARSSKRYAFTVRIRSVLHPLRISLKTGRNVLFQTELNLRTHGVERGLVVVAATKQRAGRRWKLPHGVHPVVADSRWLPETWYAYDGVRMLVMHADALRRLNDRQYAALERWIENGGYLLVSGGLNLGTFFEKRIQELLGVEVMGFERMTTLQVMAGYTGSALRSSVPFLVVRTRMTDASVLLREERVPIVAERRLARGKIVFLALDFEAGYFNQWAGRDIFWGQIYSRRPEAPPPQLGMHPAEAVAWLNSLTPLRFQSLIQAALILLSLYAAARLLTAGLRMSTVIKWERVWLYTGLLTGASVFAFWFYFGRTPPRPVLCSSIGWLQKTEGRSVIPYRRVIGLYALQDTVCRVPVPARQPPPVPVAMAASDREPLLPASFRISENGAEPVAEIPLERWSHRFFELESYTRLPVEGRVEKYGNRLTISIRNSTARAIGGSLFYYAGAIYRLGTIPAGGRLEKELVPTEGMPAAAVPSSAEPPAGNESERLFRPDASPDRLADALIKRRLARIHAEHALRSETAFLIATVIPGPLPLRLPPDQADSREVTVLEWELAVARR